MRNFSGEPEATGATHPGRSHTSTSTPLVPARFQASHVIAHPFLALTGCGLGPDHNASVHQAHGPGTAGRVGIRPHLPTVVPELHGLQPLFLGLPHPRGDPRRVHAPPPPPLSRNSTPPSSSPSSSPPPLTIRAAHTPPPPHDRTYSSPPASSRLGAPLYASSPARSVSHPWLAATDPHASIHASGSARSSQSAVTSRRLVTAAGMSAAVWPGQTRRNPGTRSATRAAILPCQAEGKSSSGYRPR